MPDESFDYTFCSNRMFKLIFGPDKNHVSYLKVIMNQCWASGKCLIFLDKMFHVFVSGTDVSSHQMRVFPFVCLVSGLCCTLFLKKIMSIISM